MKKPAGMALDLALIYAILGSLWIFLSDALLASIISDPTTLTHYQTYKGWFYVAITSALVFFLIRQALNARAAIEDKLRESERRFREVFENTSDGLFLLDVTEDLRFRIISFNPVEERLAGRSTAEVSGKFIDEIFPDESARQTIEKYRRCVEVGAVINYEEEIALPAGISHFYMTLVPVRNENGRIYRIAGIARDITERKQAEKRQMQLAHFDQLTGLPNRALFTDRINYAISMAQRSHSQLAVMFLDLDHFKNINDTLGHRIGDELLIEVTKHLKSAIRDEDTMSRQGGDEFILVLPGIDANGAAHVAEKLLAAVAHAYRIERHEMHITTSIGIAMYPSDGKDFESLYKCVDVAMYRAKKDGRNNYRFFTQEMQLHSARTLQLENALRHAMDRHQLRLHYQPQLSLQDGHIIGAEALLRWQHPEMGEISPAEFIPVAEASGQILQIGEWVLRSAIHQLKSWMDSGMEPMVIAVNISAVQFRHANLPALVTQILEEEKLSPQYLELELTESVAMDDPLAAITVMSNLHERGVRMSIDDFGTGYSSLNYLKRFQVYKLKIDQSFVCDITEDPEDKAIVAAIISMANSLGMQTIAEGVETSGQLAFLRLQGCNEVQGYYFSKPLPVDEFEAYARKMREA